MKKIILLSLVLFSGYFLKAQNPEKSLNKMIIQGMKDWQIPGLSTVVVKDGEVVFKKAYGIKDIETNEPVDEHTLFTMASTTKAFIGISMGMLVDQGKVNWDDKVVDHLPDFKLSDPYITANAQIKDLFTHNLGIGNADFLWINENFNTNEIIDHFQYAQKVYPLRGGYTYQNIMYVIAGEVIHKITGMEWYEFTKKNIYNRLEMARTVGLSSQIFDLGNYTSPHLEDLEGKVQKLPIPILDEIGAAGSQWSCIDDISNYLIFLQGKGVYKGDTLLTQSTFNYLFKPHTLVTDNGFYPTQKLTNPSWKSYGIGWFQHDYKGEKLDFHTGSIFGLVAIAGIMRNKDVAVYVFANIDHAELRHAIMYKALDLYAFEDDSRDWNTEIVDLYSPGKESVVKYYKDRDEKRVKNTKPSLTLENYTGTYTNDLYGEITIALENGKLNSTHGKVKYAYDHWNYDTFMSNIDPRFLINFWITFRLDSEGKVSSMEDEQGFVWEKTK